MFRTHFLLLCDTVWFDRQKIVPRWKCSQQGLRIIFNWIMIFGKRHCCRVFVTLPSVAFYRHLYSPYISTALQATAEQSPWISSSTGVCWRLFLPVIHSARCHLPLDHGLSRCSGTVCLPKEKLSTGKWWWFLDFLTSDCPLFWITLDWNLQSSFCFRYAIVSTWHITLNSRYYRTCYLFRIILCSILIPYL